MLQIIIVSHQIAEHRLPSKHPSGPASHFEEIRQNGVTATFSRIGGIRVGDIPDFSAPVLFDELGGYQNIPEANISDDLTNK